MKKLAIVIPYYKIKHFKEVLEALAQQTNQKFHIYIGDDCSPNSPVELINKYKTKLRIQYKRFETNLGSISLTKQWDRCIGMLDDEEWIWILPDDDLPSENVVEEFYKALENNKNNNIKVFRFPMKIIDNVGNIISDIKHNDPLIEDNLEFYSRIVRGKTSSSLGDNIFHRKSLEQTGGFVDFPKAWGSDHATVLNVAAGGTLYFMKSALLSFRMSGENISSDSSDGMIKMKSRIQFVEWLKDNEDIFLRKPDNEFYKYFYWKGEYYFLNEWQFSFSLLSELYRLRKVCFDSSSVLPILKVMIQKLGIFK